MGVWVGEANTIKSFGFHQTVASALIHVMFQLIAGCASPHKNPYVFPVYCYSYLLVQYLRLFSRYVEMVGRGQGLHCSVYPFFMIWEDKCLLILLVD